MRRDKCLSIICLLCINSHEIQRENSNTTIEMIHFTGKFLLESGLLHFFLHFDTSMRVVRIGKQNSWRVGPLETIFGKFLISTHYSNNYTARIFLSHRSLLYRRVVSTYMFLNEKLFLQARKCPGCEENAPWHQCAHSKYKGRGQSRRCVAPVIRALAEGSSIFFEPCRDLDTVLLRVSCLKQC